MFIPRVISYNSMKFGYSERLTFSVKRVSRKDEKVTLILVRVLITLIWITNLSPQIIINRFTFQLGS